MEVVTGSYTARIGPGGCLQSITAGGVEFLQADARWKSSSFLVDWARPGCIGIVRSDIRRRHLDQVTIGEHNEVIATGTEARVVYAFREKDFAITPHSAPGRYFLIFPSGNVTHSLDLVTDNILSMTEGRAVGFWQEGMRWATKQGPVLRFDEKLDGYASYFWWGNDPKPEVPVERAVSISFRDTKTQGRPSYTITPMAAPDPANAIELRVSAEDRNFLMPGGKPVHFDIQAINLANSRIVCDAEFQIRNYLTRETIGKIATRLELNGKAAQAVRADLSLRAPGPYRGALLIRDGEKILRELAWVFVYDFAGYHPETTRQSDFGEFWAQTLHELRGIPMDVKMIVNEERSTDKAACCEVSIASLDNRRVWGWYFHPRKKGKYPLYFCVPSTGVHTNSHVSGRALNGEWCRFNFTVHGFDLRLSDMPEGPHPWKSYHTLGLASRETASWRWIYASMVRCMDFVCSRDEVDKEKIMVFGSSQGGGLALVLAGLAPDRVAACFPAYPGLPRLDWTVKYDTGYWPFKMANAKPEEQTEEEFLRTLSYFDAANFTPDITCPTVALVGLLDWVTASGNAVCAFAHLGKGNVQLICDPWGGHGSARPEFNRLFQYDAHYRFLRGESPVIAPSK